MHPIQDAARVQSNFQYMASHMSPGCCPVLYPLDEPLPSSLQPAALKLVLRECVHRFHRPTGNLPLCMWLYKGTADCDRASIHTVH